MRKKALSWILAVTMVISLFPALPVTAGAVITETDCRIVQTGVAYATLDAAIAEVTSGQTIQLLKDVTHNTIIMANSQSFVLDVNGFNLTVSVINQTCLYASVGYDLSVTDSQGDGSLVLETSGGTNLCGIYANGADSEINIYVSTSISITGDSCYGVYAYNGGLVSVTGDVSVTGTNSKGAYAENGSTIDITGDITASNAGTVGLEMRYGGQAEIVGDITAETGMYVSNIDDYGTNINTYLTPSVNMTGNIIASGYAVNASGDADITIEGNVTGGVYMANTSADSTIDITGDIDYYYGPAVYNGTGTVVVTGTITSADGFGVASDSNFTLNGDIIAKHGVHSSAPSGNIIINGDITSDGGFGVYVYNGAVVTVNGAISGAATYIRLDYVEYTEGSGTVDGDYMVYSCYTNNNPTYVHTVYVLIPPPVCEVDGVQYATLDEGIEAAAVDEDTVKLLSDIDYTGQISPTADIWFNLNGYTLNVTNTAGAALWVHDDIDVYVFGEGEFNLTGSWGVTIGENASAEVTNVTATAANGLGVDIGYDTSGIHVYGDVIANGDSGAFGVSGRGHAVIEGNVYAQGTNGTGVGALSGADITVNGYIIVSEFGTYLSLPGDIRAEGDYDSIVNNYYIYTYGGATVRARQEVCALNGTPYLFLEDALADAESGDTITLLTDIRYEGDIILIEKDLHFDLAAYKLNIGRTGSEPALKADGSTVTIDDSDGGELNIVAGYVGVRVLNEGSATVTSISGLNGYGIIGESDGSVTVKEDITVTDYIGAGLYLYSGATAHVMGDIYGREGVTVQQSGSEAVVDGNITATSGPCVYVTNGGSITVYGDLHGNYRTVQGGSDGGTIHVMGDVVADRWEGVYAWGGADIVIDGSVTSPYGLWAWAEGTTVWVKGNSVTTASIAENNIDPTYGAYAFNCAEITVGGTITAANPANYVKVGETVMTEAEGSLQGRYTVYTDGTSSVRLTGIEFFKDDFDSGMDGWDQSNTEWTCWSVTNTLTSPTTTPHSGSYALKFASASLPIETQSRLYQTESLNLSNGTDYRLEFWMYHDSNWFDYNDYVTVQISIDGGISWDNLATDGSGTFYRYGVDGWKKEALSLAAYAGEPDVRIAFLGVCQWGNNIFIDDVSVSHKCIIDGCEVTEAYGGFVSSQEIEGETYYEVSTPEQLAHISDHLDLNFIQTADIDLSGYNGGYWIPIGGFTYPQYFTGKYLGDGHVIENLRCFLDSGEVNDSYFGLFAYINGSDTLVSDLTVTVAGANITNNSTCFGSIAGAIDGSTIQNCNVTILGDIITQTRYGNVGGIVGRADSNYDSELKAYVGGVENCSVTLESGSIRNDSLLGYAGGIVGVDYASLQNCDVVVGAGEFIKATRIGGISGATYKVYNAFTDCTVTGEGSLQICPNNEYDTYIGGIVGYASELTIENCRNSVLVDATGMSEIAHGEQVYAGGIVGYVTSNATIFGCVNTGDVELVIADNVVNDLGGQVDPDGNEYAFAGGIAGYVYGYYYAVTIENCENNANVSAVNLIPTLRAYAGGLVGHIDSYDAETAGVTVLNCANLGQSMEVSATAATTMVGGLAGSTTYADFGTPNILIQNCYNEAGVYTESSGLPDPDSFCVGVAAGGLIGAAGEATINYCYSTAPNISAVNGYGDVYAGGLFGLLYNTAASQNYCETNENVTRAAGAIVDGMTIVGEDDVSGCYECATATQLKAKSFYGSGWSWYTSGGTAPDYYSSSAPWRMTAANTYPVLKGEIYIEPAAPGGGGTTVTYYAITASAGAGGSINPSGSVSVQKSQAKTFLITPNTGYIITDVLVDGVSMGAVTEYTFSSVSEDHTITAVFEHPSNRFSDVDGSKWYREGIDYVLMAGLFNGTSDTTFEPDTDMTRAMLVTVLWRLENEPNSTLADLFSDIASGIWYTEPVAWAAENGIVEGYDPDTFGPYDPITREQMAVILYRYASLKGYVTTAAADLSAFSDTGDTSGWAMTAMEWAVAEGLINGVSNTSLNPAGNASRAQVATILMRFVKNIVN